QAMTENSGLTGQVMTLVAELAASGVEQVKGIDLNNNSITAIQSVTQTTASTAEESASASQEIAAQAQILGSVTSDIDSVVGGAGNAKTDRTEIVFGG